jgi:hypothetical protein
MDVLSTLFALLAILAYVSYVRRRQRSHDTRDRLLCLRPHGQAMVVTLPVLLLLLDYWPLDRAEMRAARGGLLFLIREKIPLFGLAVGAGAITVFGSARRCSAVLSALRSLRGWRIRPSPVLPTFATCSGRAPGRLLPSATAGRCRLWQRSHSAFPRCS